MTNTTDTPRTDAQKWCAYCGVWGDHQSGYCVPFLRDREVTLTHQLADARLEVERLKDQLNQRTEAAIADLKSESEARQKAEAENVCLQELIQEFYEWSRRDFPTEQEVREIMNRYHDILNK